MSLILSSTLVGGCASSSRGGKPDHNELKEQKIDEVRVKDFASRGYDSGTEYATEASKLSVNFESFNNPISIVQPKRQGKYPLVIYLPGMGESNDAGNKICAAWASSGYVVIAIQLLKDDETIFLTPAGKEGDFSYIRHDRYSPEVVSSRLGLLAKFVNYVNQSI